MTDYRVTVEALKDSIKQFMESDNGHYIHLGMERKITESDRNGRIYLGIYCYTLNGKYKGNYKCGYVEKETGEYTAGQYDSVNAETMTWIG